MLLPSNQAHRRSFRLVKAAWLCREAQGPPFVFLVPSGNLFLIESVLANWQSRSFLSTSQDYPHSRSSVIDWEVRCAGRCAVQQYDRCEVIASLLQSDVYIKACLVGPFHSFLTLSSITIQSPQVCSISCTNPSINDYTRPPT